MSKRIYSTGTLESNNKHLAWFINISVLIYVEIIQGVRNKKELNAFMKALGILNARVIQIDEAIFVKAMFIMEQYAHPFHSFLVEIRP